MSGSTESVPYNLQYTTSKKKRDSPSSSILKAPTPIFVTSRSSLRTRRLKFANGVHGDTEDLDNEINDMREGSHDSASSVSTGEVSDSFKFNYEWSSPEQKYIEVNVSPNKKMTVSLDSWKAFLEYQKYEDHSNETEKTDYTYSDLSKFRDREIIPGFRIRPNLSRKPIRSNMKYTLGTSLYSPDVNYSVKRTIIRTNSDGKLNSDSLANERRKSFQNEMSEHSKYDYSHADTLRCDDNYGNYSGFGDDGKILRRGDAFEFSNISFGQKSHLGRQWGFDETDDECITSTGHEVRPSSYNSGWGMKSVVVFITTVFTTMFSGISSMFTSFKDLFSKYILRRKDMYPYKYSTASAGSWMPGTKSSTYYSYGSYGNYAARANRTWTDWWYQSFLYGLYRKIMSPISNLSQYVRTKYYQSSRRGKLLWFLIPLLLLLGFYTVFKDFLPNPDTILNNVLKLFTSIWAMITFAFLVLLPSILFESVPHFVTTVIPNFVTQTLPDFFMTTVPYYFLAFIDFVLNISIVGIWNVLVDCLIYAAAFWLFKAEGEDAYVSNKITAFKCKANHYVTPVRNQMNTVWNRISTYSENVFGQSLQPLSYLLQSLISIFTTLSSWVLTLLSGALTAILSVFYALGDVLYSIWNFFTDIFMDVVDKKDHISGAVFNFFSDIISTILGGALFVLRLFGSTFELLKNFFTFSSASHKPDVKLQSMQIDLPDRELYSNADWDILKKRIEDLELELRQLKAAKIEGSAVHQRQLEDNYKALQKYQLRMKEAMRRQNMKQMQLSQTSVQYYLDNLTDELKKWIVAHFMMKTDFKDIDENKFAVLMAKYSNRSGEELKMLQDEFSHFVRQYNDELSSLKSDLIISRDQDYSGVSLSLIKRIIADEIKLHDADKTGKVDFALQSAGGQVLGVKCTKNYNYCVRYNDIFGMMYCRQSRPNTPEEAINPGMAPGQCWAFAGSQGFLILELSHSIIVTGFTMEHISRLLSPDGRIESAPRKFSMWGLKSEFDLEPFFFGDYEYKDNNETYQYFPVANYTSQPYKIVELNIASNHGNPDYTCLYRIRVHGNIFPSPVKDSL